VFVMRSFGIATLRGVKQNWFVSEEQIRRKRRVRYSGKHPRKFHEKYKELNPGLYPETVAKVIAAGKTPAGAHRSIMVAEILEALAPRPGDIAVDATLGYGGHAEAILARIQPGGRLVGLDVDGLELPKTEGRLRAAGFGPEVFTAVQSNFAGIQKALGQLGIAGANVVLADLGVSSMQLDQPERGFSFKWEGPLDMRLNPARGRPASALLAAVSEEGLRELLVENADEPHAERLARALAGRRNFATTTELTAGVREALAGVAREEVERSVRRVFQALRIVVNDEFSALEAFLRALPECVAAGGRVAILTFHSGEDRRVKQAFKEFQQAGVYAAVSEEVTRPSAEEVRGNSRAAPAKLRWAVRR
jgi:16S rRNA (cytosine1402-N4)-methyltransferase